MAPPLLLAKRLRTADTAMTESARRFLCGNDAFAQHRQKRFSKADSDQADCDMCARFAVFADQA
jgi:hypothetical protein